MLSGAKRRAGRYADQGKAGIRNECRPWGKYNDYILLSIKI